MIKSEDEKYKKILTYLTPRSLCWVINDFFTQKELSTIASRLNMYQEDKNIPSDVIASDISCKFFQNDDTGKMITSILSRKKPREINKLSTMNAEQLENYIGNGKSIFNENRVGKILWAISTDKRKEINEKSIDFIKKIEKLISNKIDENRKEKMKILDSKGKNEKNINKIIEKVNPSFKLQSKPLLNNRPISNLNMNQKFLLLQEENKKIKSELEKNKNSLLKSETQLKENKKLEKENLRLNSIIKELSKKNEESSNSLILMERKMLQLKGEITRWDIKYKKLRRNQSEGRYREQNEYISSQLRVGVFVDVQNIYYGAKKSYQAKLDFNRLLTIVTKDRFLFTAIAYIVQTPEISQEDFIKALERVGYKVKSKDLKRRADGSAKGDWDLGMAMDIISLVDKLDVVVLVSGDEDFVDLVKMLKSNEVAVEIAAFQNNTSMELIEICDTFYPLEEDMVI